MSIAKMCSSFLLLSLHAIHSQATAPSFLEVTSQGQASMMCDCEKVRCNCVKRCDCKMPDDGGVFLETEERHIPIEWQSAFLEEESHDLSTHTVEEHTGGVMQALECDCDKVKCNCLKHCECNTGAGGSGASLTNIQINHQKDDDKAASITAVGTKPMAPDMPSKPAPHTHQRHKAHAEKHRRQQHHHRHSDEDNSSN